MLSDPRTDPRQAVVDRVLALWPEITVAAWAHALDPATLAGLVSQESQGDPWAVNVEPLYRYLVGDDPGEHLSNPAIESLQDDLALQKISWGLCQVMGGVAREQGFAGWLTQLCDPAVGLETGARHLAAKIKQAHGDLHAGLQLYNGGGDPRYADKVLAWAAYFPAQ